MIHWLPHLNDITGLQIKSPATGIIAPLNTHADLLYNANVLEQALCIKLQHGTLVSPFHGCFNSLLSGGHRVSIKHQSGLTMLIDLPDITTLTNGNLAKSLVRSGQVVRAGQPIIQLDLQLLQANDDKVVVLILMPHPAITAVFSAERFVDAAQDSAIIIQLKNS
jgi:sugar PTS system EIIA component